MGNVNCCKNQTNENELEAEENNNRDENLHDSEQRLKKLIKEKEKTLKSFSNENLYKNQKQSTKYGNTYEVEIKDSGPKNILTFKNENDNNSKNENEDKEKKKQNIDNISNKNQQNFNINKNENNINNKNFDINKNSSLNNSNNNNILEEKIEKKQNVMTDINNEEKKKENDNNEFKQNQVKTQVVFNNILFQEQKNNKNEFKGFGFQSFNNYNFSNPKKSEEDLNKYLEQQIELQKRVIDLSKTNNDNNLNKNEDSNVKYETNNLNNNIDIFNSAFTFGGTNQNIGNNLKESYSYLGQSYNSNNDFNFQNSVTPVY